MDRETSLEALVFADRRLLFTILSHLSPSDSYCFLSVLPKWTAKRVGPKLLEVLEWIKLRHYESKRNEEEVARSVHSCVQQGFAYYTTEEARDHYSYALDKDRILFSQNNDYMTTFIKCKQRVRDGEEMRKKIKLYLI